MNVPLVTLVTPVCNTSDTGGTDNTGDTCGTGDNKLVLVWPWEHPGNSKLDSGICLGIEMPCYTVSAPGGYMVFII